MVEAAVRGLVDFSQLRFFDPGWTRRLKLILSGLSQLNLREELKFNHDYYLTLLTIPELDEQTTKALREQLENTRTAIDLAYRPWHQALEKSLEHRKQTMRDMTAIWESKFGKMDDPEVQRKIRATVEGLRLQRAAAVNAPLVRPEGSKRRRRPQQDAARRSRDGRRHGR